MKKNLPALLCTFIALATLTAFSACSTTRISPRANDVAVITIRIPNQTQLHRVLIAFYPDSAPLTVANFEKLARKKFYNGLTFHRVFPHTLVQTGDPLSRHKNRDRIGTGGPGYTLPAEIHRPNTLGAVAAARLGDDINPSRRSNGSQFYICLKPMPDLNGKYTVFGHVIRGLDVLEKISALPADSNNNPLDRVVIRSIRILPRAKAEALPAKKSSHHILPFAIFGKRI